ERVTVELPEGQLHRRSLIERWLHWRPEAAHAGPRQRTGWGAGTGRLRGLGRRPVRRVAAEGRPVAATRGTERPVARPDVVAQVAPARPGAGRLRPRWAATTRGTGGRDILARPAAGSG